MLSEFLNNNRVEILNSCEEKTKILAGLRVGSTELSKGLPLFFKQLIDELARKLGEKRSLHIVSTAASHGGEFLHLGYSLSHVVHAYGALCQAITETAIKHNAEITAREFQIFNATLDVAIASAVSEFEFRSNKATEELEVKHLASLAHELRNALSSATVAHEMMAAGNVGLGGSTAKLLESSLARMANIIDRALSDVRMRSNADVVVEKFRLMDLLEQVVMTAQIDATKKRQLISINADWSQEIEGDRLIILSAIVNVLQNAIKYSGTDTRIELKAFLFGDTIAIEIKDECGGIETSKLNSLFEPHGQHAIEHQRPGRGLSIVVRALALSQGKIAVDNRPGHGCSFKIEIPLKLVPRPSLKHSVSGEDSVQPD